MKKILSLALAVAMVLSLASVAFAATSNEYYSVEGVDEVPHKIPKDKTYVDSRNINQKGQVVSFGNTIYYPIWGATYDKNKDLVEETLGEYVTKYDAVKGVKVSTDWNLGSEWVSKVDIVKKRWSLSTDSSPIAKSPTGQKFGEYYYFLAITFKSAPTKSESADVIGEIILKKTSGDNKINRDGNYATKAGETEVLAIDIELQYSDKDAAAGEITDSSQKFEFGDDKPCDEDEEFEFTFDKWVDATFTVNTYGQGAIILKATTDYNSDIGALYPEANLDFYIGNGASFNKTGEMFLPADEGSFLYEIKNGALVEVRAEYDEYDEGFYFKTRTLGQYVVSDIELDVSASSAVTPGGDGGITVVDPSAPIVTVPTNPTTGAAA